MAIGIEEVNLPVKLKVIGLGGGGCNSIRRMIEDKIRGVELIGVNTDSQVLDKHEAGINQLTNGNSNYRKMVIGTTVTGGKGAGGDPKKGREAAEESSTQIEELVAGCDLVFLTAGMGGGTGTGAIPVFAEKAKKAGALTVAVVSTPAYFEGKKKSEIANEGLKELSQYVDATIIVPNDKIFNLDNDEITIIDAFKKADEILSNAVKGIAELLVSGGEINVDFNDLKAILQNAGTVLFGIGKGTGESAALDAVNRAINHELLGDLNIHGSAGLLANIYVPKSAKIGEYLKIMAVLQEHAAEDANIKGGLVYKPEGSDNDIEVTIIAAGFPEKQSESACATSEALCSDKKDFSIDDYESAVSSPLQSYRSQHWASSTSSSSNRFGNVDDRDVPPMLRNNRITDFSD